MLLEVVVSDAPVFSLDTEAIYPMKTTLFKVPEKAGFSNRLQ